MCIRDRDITSSAPAVDVFVPATQENLVDFAVGTKILLVGQSWKNRDDEYCMSVNGWWAFDEIAPATPTDDGEVVAAGDDDGWDA